MDISEWKRLLGNRDAAPRSRRQIWIRAVAYAVLWLVVSFFGLWLLYSIFGGDFSADRTLPISIGGAVGIAVVQLVSDLRRGRNAAPAEADSFDDLPNRLG